MRKTEMLRKNLVLTILIVIGVVALSTMPIKVVTITGEGSGIDFGFYGWFIIMNIVIYFYKIFTNYGKYKEYQKKLIRLRRKRIQEEQENHEKWFAFLRSQDI